MNKIIRILIADNEQEDVKRIKEQLHVGGIAFSAQVATDKEGFIEALSTMGPDIVLSETALSNMDGKEILEYLHKKSHQTPCIIITHGRFEKNALAIVKAGASDYVIKDNLSRLCHTVLKALEKKNLHIELALLREELEDAKAKNLSLAKTICDDINYKNLISERNAIIEQAMDGIALTDSEGNLIYVNPAWAAMHGYTPKEMIGTNLSLGHTQQQYRQEVVPVIHEIKKTGTWRGEIGHAKKDGSTFRTQMSVFLKYDEHGQEAGFVGFARDITEELELKSQLIQAQKMEAIGALAGGMAHDFNNMLSPILGYAGMLLEELGPDNENYKKIFHIQRSGEHARNLINSLLAFSRKQSLEMKSQELGEIIDTYENMLRRLIREDIDLEISYKKQNIMIQADTSQIGQILLNLSMNAQDAMPNGGKLRVAIDSVDLDEKYCLAHPEARSGPNALLSIQDTGHGISADIREHIFEPFFTTRNAEQKAGLGLSSVYGIIRQHGGHITVESKEMHGTTFNIYLPREEFIPYVQTPAINNDPLLRGTETIFVVEDSPSVCELACAILQKFGYTVLSAGGPEECLRILKSYKGPIHLLLTDIVLPSMNGKELADTVLATSPETRVIYMSGYAQDIIASRGIVKERVNFLQKPFTIQTLTEKVRMALDEIFPGQAHAHEDRLPSEPEIS